MFINHLLNKIRWARWMIEVSVKTTTKPLWLIQAWQNRQHFCPLKSNWITHDEQNALLIKELTPTCPNGGRRGYKKQTLTGRDIPIPSCQSGFNNVASGTICPHCVPNIYTSHAAICTSSSGRFAFYIFIEPSGRNGIQLVTKFGWKWSRSC